MLIGTAMSSSMVGVLDGRDTQRKFGSYKRSWTNIDLMISLQRKLDDRDRRREWCENGGFGPRGIVCRSGGSEA